ncbi:Type II secretion system F domain protein [Ferroglobus placidus DSM 10642]|uniref:Type II secretion system F domain protein n=1 Tax=Ferroglobus placidus (strain DSM 10642 / AEDII12DO) TaxID=589924 RepID=D3RYX2_FERPA|nr:type II secretion system F family protein [Ferroglobus placidus]ADC65685.1 Type II secretion system F domain protein [Ferroglobus placidus DSM 10642]
MSSKLEHISIFYPKVLAKYYFKKYLKNKSNYEWLEGSLRASRIPLTVPEFLAVVNFYTILSIPLAIFLSYLSYLISEDVYGFVVNVIPVRLGIPNPKFFFSLGLASLIALLTLLVVRNILLRIPSFIARSRKAKIDATLYHVASLMLGMAKGGTPLLELFRTVAEERHVTGEVGKEFSIIVRNVTVFGKDIITSIKEVAATTPSQKLRDFLEDLAGVLEGGSSLSEFLEFKIAHLAEERERAYQLYISSYEILAEIYVAMLIVAPLFSLIVFVVMNMIGESTINLMKAMVYLYIPIGGLFFVYLVKSSKLLEEKKWRGESVVEVYLHATVNGKSSRLKRKSGIVVFMKRASKWLERAIKMRAFLRNPKLIFLLSIPAAAVFAAVFFKVMKMESLLTFSFVIATLPYVLLYEYRSYKLRKLEKHLPDFLRGLGSLNESGLNIVTAIKVLSATQLGVLTEEVRKIRKDIEWGRLVTEALERFEDRVGSSLVSKVVSIINKALMATSNVKAAILAAAADVELLLDFRERLKNAMFTYMVIIYVTFAVFLFTVVVVLQNFISVFSNISVGQITGIYFNPPDLANLTSLFYHASLINALVNGIIAGVMSEESVSAGLKHSIILMLTSLLVFAYVVGVGI